MEIINVGTESCRINLGIRGENLARCVVFDLSGFISTYGEGIAVLLAKRSGDTDAYPVSNFVQEGNTLTWNLTDVDTAQARHGKAELFWYVDSVLAKSIVYTTWVQSDIGEATSEAPDPYESWMDSLLSLGAETLANAQAAENAQRLAEAAQTAAEEAQVKAENAQNAAETARSHAETAQEKAKQAQEAAEDAADRAEQQAATSGFIQMEIDDTGHLIYTRSDVVDLNFRISNGHLFVEAS